AGDGIRDFHVTGVQTCALPICSRPTAPELLIKAWKGTAMKLISTDFLFTISAAEHVPGYQRDGSSMLKIYHGPMIRTSGLAAPRSEERRVGKDCRSRRRRHH